MNTCYGVRCLLPFAYNQSEPMRLASAQQLELHAEAIDFRPANNTRQLEPAKFHGLKLEGHLGSEGGNLTSVNEHPANANVSCDSREGSATIRSARHRDSDDTSEIGSLLVHSDLEQLLAVTEQ